MPVARTVCPRNCYCTCGMLVTVQDGRITRIEGDPANAATGGHVCLKGLSYARRVSAPNRLLYPLKRVNDGAFERVGWEQAIDDIAARLDRVRREHGPEAVLYYEASGSHGALGQLAMAFWHQFGGCTLTYGDLCWPAGLEATRLTYGANLHSHPRLTLDSRFILLWGHNPAETNIHQWRLVLEAQERGARVAVIDPRSTDTTDAADLHLQPRPGTDGALALGFARVIVDAGLHDAAFLREHAEGMEAFHDRLREFPLGRVAEITGLRPEAIREVALAYARTRPALLVAGFGLQRTHHGGQTMRAAALLPALTGNIGVAGGGWQYANLASHVVSAPPLPPEPPGVRRAIPVARLGPGLAELDSPRVAAAWVEKGNPASQNPRSRLVREAFSQLGLLVVVDQVLTDTARLAHYVLPAKTMFEEEDVCTAYWHPYVQRRAKILEPPGEVKTETEIWRLLSGRLGLETKYFPRGDAEVRALLRTLLPPPITLEGLEDGPGLAEGVGDVAFEDLCFPTPSGKIQFVSDEAARAWGVDAVPDYAPLPEGHASERARRFPLQLLSCKTRDRIHSQFGTVDWVREVERPHLLDMHPRDARARGLEEGDAATAWNDRGRIELRVRFDEGLRPGVVHVLEGRCHEGDPDVNVLTDAGVTDMNHGATFYECLVEVAAAGSATPRSTAETQRAQRQNVQQIKKSRKLEPPAVDRRSSTVSRQSSFLLDLGRCTGCSACVLACRLENGWDSATPWRRVLPLNLRRRPGGPTYFLSVACHHCERPACLRACPTGAYDRRADGVVVHRAEKCLGCRYCEMACPFGAPKYSEALKVMTKCHLCHHRLDEGEWPACVAACPTEALRLGEGGRDGFTLRSTMAGARRVPLRETPSRPARVADEEHDVPRGFRLAEHVPGFTDPAGCRPATRFVEPRGARRAALLRALEDRLRT